MQLYATSGGDSDGLDDENAWLQRISTPTSLDKNIGDEGDSTLVDLMATMPLVQKTTHWKVTAKK